MLTEICQYLRNWFEREKLQGDFVISSGALTYADGTTLPLISGQYYRIIGSLFNDGVHKLGDAQDTLTDEPEFSGAVWSMAVPPVVVELAGDIDEWITANTAAINSPYASESFGGYSYSLRSSYSAAAGGDSGGVTWQSQFMARLTPWRKI